MIASLSRSRAALGGGSSRASARMLWRASDVRAAASTPLPQTSPITATHDAPGGEEVVEVAAHLHPVAHRRVERRRLEAGDLRQSGREQAALERVRDP